MFPAPVIVKMSPNGCHLPASKRSGFSDAYVASGTKPEPSVGRSTPVGVPNPHARMAFWRGWAFSVSPWSR